MKKLIAVLLAFSIVLTSSSCTSSQKPVNGFQALKVSPVGTDRTWFVLTKDDFINTLNQSGRESDYPELILKEDIDGDGESYSNPYADIHYYTVGDSSNPYYIAIAYGVHAKSPYSQYSLDCVYMVSVKTSIDNEADAEAIGYYLDQIVGMFNPRDKEKIEEDLLLFQPVEGFVLDYKNGNVQYARLPGSVIIEANPDEAEYAVSPEPVEPSEEPIPPHLKKPE